MRVKMMLAIAAILLATLGIWFTATRSIAQEPIMLASQDAKVELYITTWCPYCQRAIKFFESRGIAITVYDIEKDRDAARRKSELDPRRGVPFAVINGKHIHGYSEQAYLRALNGK